MSRFKRKGDDVRWDLEPFEVDLLRRLHDGLERTLTHGSADDPVVQRLFPPTVADDPIANEELTRLVRDDLLASKLDGLRALLDILSRTESKGERQRAFLSDDEPFLVLGVLNDLRLAIGARLGTALLDREHVEKGSPEETSLAVMDHLAWMQEQLLQILDPAAVDGPEA